MSTLATWSLIGFGNIGHEVLRQVHQPGVAARLGLEIEPLFIIKSQGIFEADGKTASRHKNLSDMSDLPDVTFIALPSSDDGQVGYGYIMPLLEAGKTVITAEKGALANHFSKLQAASDNFSRLGINATVGGGTRVLQVVREYCQDVDNITEIHLALNGTLAAMLEWVSPLEGQGISLAQAAKRAIDQKYAEPGSASPEAIISAEAEGDIPKKLAIFYNSVGLAKTSLGWQSLRFSLSDEEVKQATNPSQPYRFIASLYSPIYLQNNPSNLADDMIGGFALDHDGWKLMAGFRLADPSSIIGPLVSLKGPGNGIVIGLGPEESDGVYSVTGPGAGVNPTVNTMLDDFLRLKRLQAI